jgi:hypothetical protein
MDKNDMILELLRDLKADVTKIRDNGCSKAGMHESIEERIHTLETGNRDTKLLSVLTLPWPWIFASVAVFSPNAVAIVEVVKGAVQ